MSAGSDATKAKWESITKEYDKNPARCLGCGKPLPYLKRRNKFCSHSCAATTNNNGVRRNWTNVTTCAHCGNVTTHGNKYCNAQCRSDFGYKAWIERWLAGDVEGNYVVKGGYKPSKYIYRWLEEQGRRCSLCGTSEWTGKPVPLVLDHIDGKRANSKPDNVRLICRNCDGLLPTFCGRNIGNSK